MKKTNKTQEVLKYLQKNGTITSMEAFEKFGATRLSAIIFELRKKYNIDTIEMVCNDRYGRECHFARYTYKGEIDNGYTMAKEA